MIQLIIVRHGETESNRRGTFLGWTDIELNKLGIEQAYSAKEKLKGIDFDGVFSSPLKRAAVTAEIINNGSKTGIQYVDSLKERNFGMWDDLTFKEISMKYPEEYSCWVADPAYCMPDGESSIDMYKRVSAFADNLVQRCDKGRYLIITHLGCIRYIVAHLLNMGMEGAWRFRVGNCGITRLEINDEKYAYLTQLNG